LNFRSAKLGNDDSPPQDLPRSLGGGANILAGAQRASHEHQRAGGFDDFTFNGDEFADAHGSEELHVKADRRLLAALGGGGRKAKRGIEQRRQHAAVGEAAAVGVSFGNDEPAQRAILIAAVPNWADSFEEGPGFDFLPAGCGRIK
jgi:hypothetical protein